MKTTLITIITSLFFSACANNNRTEDWNARRAANASFQEERLARFQKDLIMNVRNNSAGFDAARRNTFEINY